MLISLLQENQDSGCRQSVSGAVAVRQHPFDVGFTVEDFAAQLDVGYPPLVAVVLKRPAANFQTCRHFLVGEETLAAQCRSGNWLSDARNYPAVGQCCS